MHQITIAAQNKWIRFNFKSREIIATFPSKFTNIHSANQTRNRIVAASDSRLLLFNTSNMELVSDIETASVIKSLTTHGDLILITSGSFRLNSHDPMVKVYDIRLKAYRAPIAFPYGAAFVTFHPRLSGTVVIASPYGQVQIHSIERPQDFSIVYTSVYNIGITNLQISPSGQAIAFVDMSGMFHLLATTSYPRFNRSPETVAMPSSYYKPDSNPVAIDDYTYPLNSVGMPHYTRLLLSVWPSNQVVNVARPPVSIEPPSAPIVVLKDGTKIYQFQGKHRRYQTETKSHKESKSSSYQPKFRSELERAGISSNNPNKLLENEDTNLHDISKAYKQLCIQYSKFGASDFDFSFFNKTCFSGLETQLDYAYLNSFLQILRYIPVFYNLAMNHVARDCPNDLCLLCQAGFLFDMLEKSRGEHCRAANLYQTLSEYPVAQESGFLPKSSQMKNGSNLSGIVQAFAHFFLETIYLQATYAQTIPENTITDDLALIYNERKVCLECGAQTQNRIAHFALDLVYDFVTEDTTFESLLESSLSIKFQNTGSCSMCHRNAPFYNEKVLERLPECLTISCNVAGPENRGFWRRQGAPRRRLNIFQGNDSLAIFNSEAPVYASEGLAEYELTGILAEVTDQSDCSHLVAIVKVPEDLEANKPSKWYLFNDFLVKELSEDEAVNFTPVWKIPSLLCYRKKNSVRDSFDKSWKESINKSVLYDATSINNVNQPYVFSEEDQLDENSLLAIDAEFVCLQEAEKEEKSDGSVRFIQPSQLSLARVSVLKAESGTEDCTTVIDDWIMTKQDVVDYVTKFSGIKEGDLDPRTSTHPLVPLRKAYRKLWVLLNLGCVFVGHGLQNDFRTINLHVRAEQIRDT
ncbi:hypothetical protein CANCADRAFT_32279, partial [Tortispora caseinolytica NRRL Y-17796]